jgi:hypothetical protein
MLKYGILIILFSSSMSFAGAVHWAVGPVRGEIHTQGDLVLTSAEAVLTCHYCTVSTCAGGPTDEEVLNTRVAPTDPAHYGLSVASGTLNSWHLFGTLKACGYVLNLKGVDSRTQQKVSGSISLAGSYADSKDPVWDQDKLGESLTEKFTDKPLELIVRQLGLSEPRIFEVER